jgi:hypothetical protein
LMIRELLVREIVTRTQTPKRLYKKVISKPKNQLLAAICGNQVDRH